MKRILSLLAVAVALASTIPVGAAEPVINSTVPAQSSRPALSDSQKEQLRTLKDKFKAANSGKFEQLKALKKELRDQMTKESVDRSAVLAIQEKLNSLHAEMATARVNNMLDAQAIFTPEQRKAMRDRMLAHRERKGGEFSGGGGDCSGGAGMCQGRRGHGGHKFRSHGGRHRFGGHGPAGEPGEAGGPGAPDAPPANPGN